VLRGLRASNRRATALAALLCVLALPLAAAPSAVGEYAFGERRLKVPAPEDFEPATVVAPNLMPILASYLPATNRLAETFVDRANVDALAAGTAPALDPYLQLQVLRNVDGVVLSSKDFAAQSSEFERQIEAAMPGLEDEVSRLTESGNAKLADETGVDPQIGFGGSRYLGVFRREPWGLFYSMQAKVTSDRDGIRQEMPVTTSGAVVMINHQMMFLYANRYSDSDEGLVWTRDAVVRWAEDLRRVNPDDPALEPQARPLRNGIDWGQALRTGLITAAIAATVALLIGLFSRRRGSGG
jgi:hypothetical protein